MSSRDRSTQPKVLLTGAGLVEGRLHVLAYALGASACGMTFIDSEVPALLGEPLDVLLFACVGVLEYPSASGGLSGAPTAVRMVRRGDVPLMRPYSNPAV